MYEPEFTRAGRVLDREEAIRLIADGCAVTVAVPDNEDLTVTITAGNYRSGDSAAYAGIPGWTRQLGAGDLEIYAAVMAAAASLASAANSVLLARDLAGA